MNKNCKDCNNSGIFYRGGTKKSICICSWGDRLRDYAKIHPELSIKQFKEWALSLPTEPDESSLDIIARGIEEEAEAGTILEVLEQYGYKIVWNFDTMQAAMKKYDKSTEPVEGT